VTYADAKTVTIQLAPNMNTVKVAKEKIKITESDTLSTGTDRISIWVVH